jgi:hypothetical protein
MEQQIAEFLNSEAGLELLTKLIQDKLEVTVQLDRGSDYYRSSIKVTVNTFFDGKEVHNSSDEYTIN